MKWLLAIVAGAALASCVSPSQGALDFLSCDVRLDTTLIDEPHEHGAWLVADSLILFGGFRPFDAGACASVGAGATRRGGTCALSDVAPPFSVYQSGGDDTLHVVKGGRSVPFRLDEGYCNDSGW
jgi:hypothetical protein